VAVVVVAVMAALSVEAMLQVAEAEAEDAAADVEMAAWVREAVAGREKHMVFSREEVLMRLEGMKQSLLAVTLYLQRLVSLLGTALEPKQQEMNLLVPVITGWCCRYYRVL
jgi:hypothetical protein